MLHPRSERGRKIRWLAPLRRILVSRGRPPTGLAPLPGPLLVRWTADSDRLALECLADLDSRRLANVTAVEVRSHHVQLYAERALAVSTGVAGIDAYIADIDEEIEAWRRLYVEAAVIEMATLRAELFGADIG
jgi:hypothetical protein